MLVVLEEQEEQCWSCYRVKPADERKYMLEGLYVCQECCYDSGGFDYLCYEYLAQETMMNNLVSTCRLCRKDKRSRHGYKLMGNFFVCNPCYAVEAAYYC